MGPRPSRPVDELDDALDTGNLKYAVGLAEELRTEKGKPIPLSVALRFLPLIAQESPGELDAWSLRWLARWCAETPAPTIEQAAEVAACLADFASEPLVAFEALQQACE
jgi:hypothetical protein